MKLITFFWDWIQSNLKQFQYIFLLLFSDDYFQCTSDITFTTRQMKLNWFAYCWNHKLAWEINTSFCAEDDRQWHERLLLIQLWRPSFIVAFQTLWQSGQSRWSRFSQGTATWFWLVKEKVVGRKKLLVLDSLIVI